jgi:uncharacterized protein (DUF3084 family)
MSLLDSLQSAKKDKKDTKGWAIKATTVAVILGVLLVASYLFKAFFASKQLAKLLHEKDVLEERKHLKQSEAKQKKLEADRTKVKAEIKEIDKKLEGLDEDSERANTYMNDALYAINRIKDWDDVEKFVVSDDD